ncbi:MAG: NUDIX domain-containing protein [bacterium]
MDEVVKKIKLRVRLVIIKNKKILMSYVKDEDFYFFIGGKMEYGETLKHACEREVEEECKAKFTFKKILYIRDYIKPEENEHSLEIFVLGDIDKFGEIDGIIDDEYKDTHREMWLNLDRLEKYNIKPKSLVKRIIEDYKNGFNTSIGYLGEIK